MWITYSEMLSRNNFPFFFTNTMVVLLNIQNEMFWVCLVSNCTLKTRLIIFEIFQSRTSFGLAVCVCVCGACFKFSMFCHQKLLLFNVRYCFVYMSMVCDGLVFALAFVTNFFCVLQSYQLMRYAIKI